MHLVTMAERCFEEVADSAVLSHVHHAHNAVPFQTMKSSHGNHTSPLKYYGRITFDGNVFLRCHTDVDFTMSIAQIFLKGKELYTKKDDVVFCFPTLGVAVPLRPGDFLLFNALIPHCVSPRCSQDDSIMCVSMYLKSDLVGMNNNELSLTNKQAMLAKCYHTLLTKQIHYQIRQKHLTARYNFFMILSNINH